jgi:hypothetical protein
MKGEGTFCLNLLLPTSSARGIMQDHDLTAPAALTAGGVSVAIAATTVYDTLP